MSEPSNKVALCIVVSPIDWQVLAYTFSTYELALAQAIELQKGVKGTFNRTDVTSEHGLRITTFAWDLEPQVVFVQETEVATQVLEVNP